MTDGELHKLPTSLWSTLRWLKPFRRPLALAALRDLAAPARRGLADDSLYAFVARRFGSDVAQFAVDPLVRGVCAGDARQISVRFLMDTLFEHEQRYGSVLWGMWKDELARRAQAERWSVWSLEGGLQTLPEAMAARLAADGVAVLPDAWSGYYGVRPSRQRLLDAALHEVRRSLGVTARPSRLCVQLQERCIPQYRVGHRALVAGAPDESVSGLWGPGLPVRMSAWARKM
ncbi:protoporphyrinogen oxidase-like [Pollicipes pollicipes]|uniref:protoporphyrinogen oxidase-like n=1 Tax=Pollicipes pollicipes TaxID=41117 RepID=UPI001884F757|nr:protoporphyrinogen oxidase-like [Pollicipes pollicipes]